ncbi:hypothetical protein RGQ13_00680 [Thalassotalea psychrophila]|uniref:Uncharacterized protein n=1 Tax=Thalassotalea psychrophila TaxID=3065647 RepID=A0ABY9TUS8_9GAMM|nr:hypothetical protein RGQ13_00680 [Colwelliaceae bacterium SQ149]
MPLNPRIAKHTAKVDFARFCVAPFTYQYIQDFNTNKTINTPALTVEKVLKKYVSIPRREIYKSIEIYPSFHLNFSLLWTQGALIKSCSDNNKQLVQLTAKIPEKLLSRACESATNKSTVIKELLRKAITRLPNDILLWSVLEKGSKNSRYHIHIVAALDAHLKEKLTKALHEFTNVKFQNYMTVADTVHPIDIIAASYYAKDINQKHFGSKSFFSTPALNKLAKVQERDYRAFIKENKAFLIDNDKAYQKAIQVHEERRMRSKPKTFEEWEAKYIDS